jgi:hypothetical protein
MVDIRVIDRGSANPFCVNAETGKKGLCIFLKNLELNRGSKWIKRTFFEIFELSDAIRSKKNAVGILMKRFQFLRTLGLLTEKLTPRLARWM